MLSQCVYSHIFDKEGDPVDEAVSRVDKEFKYIKGTTVSAKEVDPSRHGDVSGIYFELSRAEAEAIADKDEDEEDNDWLGWMYGRSKRNCLDWWIKRIDHAGWGVQEIHPAWETHEV